MEAPFKVELKLFIKKYKPILIVGIPISIIVLIASENFFIFIFSLIFFFIIFSKTNKKGAKAFKSIDYPHYLMGLVSIIITADGSVLNSELNYVKKFLTKNFSQKESLVYLNLLKSYTTKKLSITKICKDLNEDINLRSKIQILHFLIGAAIADRLLSQNETRIIQNIARELRIPPTTIRSILAMYSYESESSQKQQAQQPRVKRNRLTLATAYDILEISSSVTDQEVKKSYRKLVRLYHPDKVIKMGEEFKQGAEEKFLKVQESYELIKSRRGFK